MRSSAVLLASLLAGCASAEPEAGEGPNAGMFRDFVDGKLDGAGHPLNARVTEDLDGPLAGTAQRGELVVNARLRVHQAGVVTVRLVDTAGQTSAEVVLTPDRLRGLGEWIDVPLHYWSDGAERRIVIEGDDLEVDYVEVFPRRFGLVLSPGSGVIGDGDELTVELPLGEAVERVELDGVDVTARFAELAARTDTEFRTLWTVPAGALAAERGEVSQLRVSSRGDAARMELRRAAAPCAFEGDPRGVPVLVTGFQPFPADGWHGNVSEVAVGAIRPAALRGARVMRLVLPVEYDRAADAVTGAIARCAPAVVISFGQGGGAIALEETAYNLKDTGEVAGGVPDNRGVIAAALPIDPAAPAERAGSLPVAAIERALFALGEAPERSDDPGRYICNNVFFAATGAIGAGRAGFIHLPYTTRFDDAAVARWGAVAETAIQAVVDDRPAR
jgi:pyroglutamyl-peptidase